MPQMLSITFGECSTAGFTSLGAPISHGIQVMVHAMMFAQPITLAGVAGQHLGLCFDFRTDVDAKSGGDFTTEGILSLDGIGIIHMRNSLQSRAMAPVGKEIRRRCRESRRPGDVAGHFMVGHVVRRTMSNDHAWPDFSK